MEIAERRKLDHPSESSKLPKVPPTLDEHKTTFRVTNVPGSYSREILHKKLSKALQIDETFDLKVHSLASDVYGDTASKWNTATVSFRAIPRQLSSVNRSEQHGSGNLADEWSLCLESESLSQIGNLTIYFDTGFDGFTPLSPTEGDDKYAIDCIVIHGWGGHAFGSFKERGGQFMWLRDEIISLFPQLRVWLYGYKSELTNETRIESVNDWSAKFYQLLVGLRAKSEADKHNRPLIFIVHSLGGWIFKEAMVALRQTSDLKANNIVECTYGALFFGVPSQGMDTEALATVVGQKPQRATEALLNEQILHRLRDKQNHSFCKAFDYGDSRIITFFETTKSKTARWDTEHNKISLDGPLKLLVRPESAKSGRGQERYEDHIGIRGDHSSMVKFRQNDRADYQVVKDKLQELVEQAEDAIRLRLDSQTAELGSALPKNNDPYKVPFSLKGLPLVPKFIARNEEMDELKSALLPEPSQLTRRKVFVLHGLGGSGKTQLAIEFARAVKYIFSSIFWLNGESIKGIRQSFVEVAQKLPRGQIPDSYRKLSQGFTEKVDEIISCVLAWFSQDKNNQWLLIYDNVDRDNSPEANDPMSFNIEEFFPKADHGSILITSRLRKLGQYGDDRNIGRMSESQGVGILNSRIGRSIEGLEKIVELVGGLPLALAHAGSFIRGTATGVDDYIRFYQEMWSKLFDSNQTSRLKDYPRSIISTYTISYEYIQGIDMDTTRVLNLFAYLDNSDLWYFLFIPALSGERIPLEMLPEWFLRTFRKEVDFIGKIQTLLDYSLIETRYDTSSYAVHPVIHNWCFHVSSRSNNEMGSLAIAIVSAACSSMDSLANWADRKRLSVQSSHICSSIKSYRWVTSENATWKNVLNGSFLTIGIFLSEHSKLAEAEAMYQRALKGYEKAWGPDHTSTLDTVNNLGNLYSDQGKLAEAEAMYQRALKGYEKAWGPDHTSTLDTVNNLGILYKKQGKLVAAETMYQRALKGYEKAWGPDHTSTLNTINNLGLLYSDQGKLAEAEAMYQRALKGKEKAWGPDHTSTLDTVNNLGGLYSDQGKLVAAEAMYQRALKGYEKAWGPDHTSTLDTVNNLGNLYSDQGKLAEAEAMYQRALKGYEKAWGPDHTSTLDTVNNLGILYKKQGKLVEAEAMYQRALKGKEKAWGPDHTSTLDTVNNLGGLYSDQGKLVAAEAMYQRALKGYEKAWGPDHTSTLDTVNNLGNLYSDQGKLAEAETMYQRALKGKEKAWGPDHTSTLDTVNNLGNLYSDQGKLAEAEAMYQRALKGKEKAWGPDHTSTLDTVNNLGGLYSDQGKLVAAEAMYQRALKGKEKAWGPDHTSTLNTVNNLGLLYSDQGKLVEAEAMYQRALKGFENALGADHIKTALVAKSLQILHKRGKRRKRDFIRRLF
ncbi:MAG: hypothetical protein M1814_005330 [Vezdaea aestivalis]|nr:MAG: hypothetical protein M1814_005330 [Vezdaea aestivalis]